MALLEAFTRTITLADTQDAIRTELETRTYPELILSWATQPGADPGFNFTVDRGDQSDFTITQGNVEIAADTGRWMVWIQSLKSGVDNNAWTTIAINLDGVRLNELRNQAHSSASATFFVDTKGAAKMIGISRSAFGALANGDTNGKIRITNIDSHT